MEKCGAHHDDGARAQSRALTEEGHEGRHIMAEVLRVVSVSRVSVQERTHRHRGVLPQVAVDAGRHAQLGGIGDDL
jgi:hypothetical protein